MIDVGYGLSNVCRHCQTVDQFKRTRETTHAEYLAVELEDSDVIVSVDSDDDEGWTEWRYHCMHCGASADDLDDLLADLPEADDDEWEDDDAEN